MSHSNGPEARLSDALQEKYDAVIDMINDLGLDDYAAQSLIDEIDTLVDFAVTEGYEE